MMKTMLLLRHAKSSWDDASVPDHDRPLKPRGIKAAGQIGQFLAQKKLIPELILCSTAVRARQTLRLVLESAGCQPPVEFTERLYHCPPSDFRRVVKQVDSTVKSLMIVGHNPGLEDFLNELTGTVQTMPTAALARIQLDLSDWSSFAEDTRGDLVNVWKPREFDKK